MEGMEGPAGAVEMFALMLLQTVAKEGMVETAVMEETEEMLVAMLEYKEVNNVERVGRVDIMGSVGRADITGRTGRKARMEIMVATSITMDTSPEGLGDLEAAVEMEEMSTTISITMEEPLPVTIFSRMAATAGMAGMAVIVLQATGSLVLSTTTQGTERRKDM